ncbi:Imm1 family immunity protein, partial [Streptomyces sp. NPDC057486]|uniref:Imm1 family immunity protein n=1 Tax=Streptomyces sp. NPDC057486 TaxID=3346145 RepID=UPI0036BA1C72
RGQHTGEPMAIYSSEDVDAMIDYLASGEESETMAALYSKQRELLPSGFPDHEFLVGVNEERQVGIVSFIDDKNYLSTGDLEGQGEEVVYHFVGNPRELPASAEIPLPLVREAVKEFLLSGGQKPACIEWQEEPEI